MRHRIQVLDAGLRVVGEALHLDKVYREIADFIPKVQYNIDLYTKFSSELKVIIVAHW